MYLRKNKVMYKVKNVLLILISTLFFKCANISAPNGGPKDIKIPSLLNQYPSNKTLNFKNNKVLLEFNEHITLNNANQEIQIIPDIDHKYKISSKKNNVELTFTENLKENTTYRINFNKSIKDITEGNLAQEITVLFSTGNQLDSLYLKGNVINIQNNKVVDAIVGIYQSHDTLNIFKQKPYLYTKSNKGKYSLENIKGGLYEVIAFEDKNNNVKLDENELFGFVNTNIKLEKSINDLNINILDITKKDSLRIKNTFVSGNKIEIEFNNSLKSIAIEAKDIVYNINEERNQLNIYNLGNYKDSISIALTLIDTNNCQMQKTLSFKTEAKKAKKELAQFVPSVKNKIITYKKPISITFSKPIIGLTEKNIVKLYIDNNKTPTILQLNKDYTVNSYKDKILINNNFTANDSIIIQVDNQQLKTINGDSLFTIKGKYLISNITETGTIQGRINTTKSSFIIQLIDNNYTVIEQITNKQNYIFTKIKPGKYNIRVIDDVNKNEKWDLGDFQNRIQAEEVKYYKEEIALKENWEVLDINIELP